MTKEEKELTITYLTKMQEEYIEGEGYERYPLPEYYALDMAIKALEQQSNDCKIFGHKENCFGGATENECNHCDYKMQAPEKPTSEDCVSRADLLKLYEDRFIELQKAHQQDKQLGVNWCINTLKEMPPVTPTFPKGATNGNMVEKIFGKDVYCTLIRMMYSSCCEKLKNWWNAPYKRGNEEW